MRLSEKAICCVVLSLVFYLIGGVAGVILVWAWFAYEVHHEAKLWKRHQQYLEEKREANRKKGYTYID